MRDVIVITDNIKDVTVKIMCAGVVIGMMTLVGLRYLPSRSSTIRKELGSGTASDAISLGMIYSCLEHKIIQLSLHFQLFNV